MTEIINPYIAGAPVTEAKMFFGRDDVFDWIQNNLTGRYADHILVVHGQRRVGKTSVLKQLNNRLPDRYIPVFFDLQGRTHTTLDRFLWWLAREIVRVLKQDHNIDLPLPEKEAFIADPEYFENQFISSLKSALDGHILLLTFDEFDNLEETEIREELARPLIDYFRRLFNNPILNFIFSIGSSGRKLENMQASYTEFFKIALYKKISFLSHEQTLNLVTCPVKGILEYDSSAVEKIYSISNGHPYFTQLICHELFSLCQKTGQRNLTVQDVDSIQDDVIERGTVNLKFTWDEASDLEKWILASLAQLEKTDQHTLAEFLKKQRVRFTNTDLTSSLLHLVEKDVLTPDHHFVIQLLQRWLQKNRPLEQVREELTEVNPIANRYIEIGQEYRNSGRFDRALESFQEALAIDSDNIQAQVSIAQVYMDQKAWPKAIEEFEQALTIDDEDVVARAGLCEAHLAIGDAAMKKGRSREAVHSYQRVLAINADHTEARQRMADINRESAEKALKEGRDQEAILLFEEALKFTPEDPALVSRANEVKEQKKARELTEILARSEKAAAVGEWDSAVAALQEALKLSPDDSQLLERLAFCKDSRRKSRLESSLAGAGQAAEAGRWKEAVDLVQEILAKEPGNPAALSMLADIELKRRNEQLQLVKSRAARAEETGRWEEAISAWNEYILLSPADPVALSSIENVKTRRLEEQANAFKTRAVTLGRAEKYAEALAAWEEYLKLKPEEAPVIQQELEKLKKLQELSGLYIEAQAAFSRKDYDRATRLFKDVVLLDEDYKDASSRMAESVRLRRVSKKAFPLRWIWIGSGAIVLFMLAWFAYKPLLSLLPARPAPTLTATATSAITPTLPTSLAKTPALSGSTPASPILPVPQLGDLTWTKVASVDFAAPDSITDIVLDGGDIDGKLYVTTANSGIYRSLDAGNSWQPMNYGLASARIDDTIIDPEDPSVLYAVASNGWIYKTIDNAKSWNLIFKAEDNFWFPYHLEMAPWDNQVVFETGNGILYRTDDGGQNWQALTSCLWFSDVTFDSSKPHTLLAANFTKPDNNGSCPGGIYRSIDDGKNWNIIGMEGQYMLGEGGLVTGGKNHQDFFVNASDANWNRKAYRSQDGGRTWGAIRDDGCYPFRVDPVDPSIIYCYANGLLLVSNDSGSTWRNHPLQGKIEGSFALYSVGKSTLIGGKGLFLSTDGGETWQDRSGGLGADRLELKAGPDGGSPLFLQEGICLIGGDHFLYTSPDGQSWGLLESKSCDLTFDLREGVYYRLDTISRDGGKSWSKLGNKSRSSIVASPITSGELYATSSSNSLEKSTDFGATWETISQGFFGQYNRLFIDNSGDVLYANAAYRFSDGGTNAIQCGSNIVTSNSDQVISIDPGDYNHAYAATQNGIYETFDGCDSWQVLKGTEGLSVNWIQVDNAASNMVYAATDLGAYVSLDAGVNWFQVNNGMGNMAVYSIAVSSKAGIYAATPFGIYKLETR
jgi:tetratricopeptide (TPR) repeat protein/photosystem II stability/assembly factor-like uncharacterized protein